MSSSSRIIPVPRQDIIVPSEYLPVDVWFGDQKVSFDGESQKISITSQIFETDTKRKIRIGAGFFYIRRVGRTFQFIVTNLEGNRLSVDNVINFLRPTMNVMQVTLSVASEDLNPFFIIDIQEELLPTIYSVGNIPRYYTGLNRQRMGAIIVSSHVPLISANDTFDVGNYFLYIKRIVQDEYSIVIGDKQGGRIGCGDEALRVLENHIVNSHSYTYVCKSSDYNPYFVAKLIQEEVRTLENWTRQDALLTLERWDQFQRGEPVFFRPPPSPMGSRNRTTVVLDKPVTDTDTIFVGYGSINGYYIYDVTDLLSSFTETQQEVYNPTTGQIEERMVLLFRDPQDIYHIFEQQELLQLNGLLMKLTSFAKILDPNGNLHSDVRKLQGIILRPRFAAMRRERAEEHTTMIEQRQSLEQYLVQHPEYVEMVYTFFLKIFEAGQYMRYWEGPGTPWCYVASTGGRPVHIETNQLMDTRSYNISAMIYQLKQMIETYPKNLIEYLNTLSKIRKGRETDETVISMIIQMSQGSYCVGFGQSDFTETGSYWIEKMGRTIPEWESSRFKR